LKREEMAAQKIKSKHYDKIIQVNVPIRFYWAEDGFDGIEFGPFKTPVSRYQTRLITEALIEIGECMESIPRVYKTSCHQRKARQNKPIRIPQVYLNAFRKEAEDR